MKKNLFVLLALAFAPLVHASQTILWSEIGRSAEIIGRLGVSLGTIVTIEATLITGKELERSGYIGGGAGEKFLRVEKVGGVPCPERPVMRFHVHDGPVMDEGESPLATAPAGTSFTLSAFEGGWTPPNPKDQTSDSGFHFIQELPPPERLKANAYFRTILNVLDPRVPKQMQPR